MIQSLSSSQLYRVGEKHPQLVSDHHLYYEDFPSNINEIQETKDDVYLNSLFSIIFCHICIALQLNDYDHEEDTRWSLKKSFKSYKYSQQLFFSDYENNEKEKEIW